MLNEVQGQAEGVRYLRRVVEGRLTNPLLLVGEVGVGRRFSVTEAAREAFSEGQADSHHSVQIDKGVHPDFVVVRGEGGRSIGVEAIREVIDQAFNFPSMVVARYVVIDGADTMTPTAANALLKTLEEPPKTTRFFLLAESTENVLPTIRSRCGIVRYGPLSESFIVERLDGVVDDPTKALVYARMAEGSVGRAVQFCLTNGLGLRNKMLGLLKLSLTRDLSSLFSAVDNVDKDIKLGLRFLEQLLYDLVMVQHDPARMTHLDAADELAQLATQIGEDRVDELVQGVHKIRRFANNNINLLFHLKSFLTTVFA